MNVTTLDKIKVDIAKLLPVIKAHNLAFERLDDNIMTTVQVVVGNMAAKVKHTYGYKHDNEVKTIYKYLDFLRALQKYNSWHFMNFIVQDIELIIQGHEMSENDWTL